MLVVDWKSPNVLSMESQMYDLSMTVRCLPIQPLNPWQLTPGLVW